MADAPKPEEHVAVYDKIVKAIPVDYIHDRQHKHQDALGDAMGALKGKKLEGVKDGIDALLEGYLAYSKAMGDKSVLSKDDKLYAENKHRYRSKIHEFITAYEKQNGTSAKTLFRRGSGHKLLSAYLEHLLETDFNHKVSDAIMDIMPENKKPDFYQKLLKHHFKTTAPTTTIDDEVFAENSTYNGALGILKTLRDQQVSNKYSVADYSAKPKDAKKK